ncbi:hypothetical protein F4826_001688 [Rahnella inusitata]|nr:hypothetical protein [Rahnella inusitata]
MKNISILFPDSIHFHSRNFKSLFDFIERHKIAHTFIKERNDWVSAYGNYSNYTAELSVYYEQLKELTNKELFEFSIRGINLFRICRDEALSFFLPNDDFRNDLKEFVQNDILISLMRNIDNTTLLLNMAAAWSWIEFWNHKLENNKNHTYACVFSGAQIYNRALLETLKTHPTTPLVLEHFFTGNEYYIEEKYEPIPNNSNLKNKNVYKNIIISETGFDLNRTKTKAINKVLLARNKNVTQPNGGKLIDTQNKKVFTIIGQVVNDFSIISTAKKYLSTIDFYIELIDKLLVDTNNFVVFKSHPWERHKNNVHIPLTFEKIQNYINTLPEEKSSRIYITEEFNLSDLIRQSDHIITLCSQSAIEAAFLGIKPIQMGNAFYGEKGFTYDYSLIDDFISDLNSKKIRKYLTISEYSDLEIFLIKTLEKSLVSVHKSGILALERKLKLPSYISLVKQVNVVKKSNVKKVAEIKLNDKPVEVTIHNEEQTIPEVIVIEPSISIKSVSRKKFVKFTKNPKRFFQDSRHKIFNFIGKSFFR